MLDTPGCWACEEIGALLAGVFCGVLFFFSQCFCTISGQGGKALRSDREVGLLIPDGFRHDEGGEGSGERGKERGGGRVCMSFWGRKMVWKMVGSLAPVAGGAWRDATFVVERTAKLLPTLP
jgi:hypothetical protein